MNLKKDTMKRLTVYDIYLVEEIEEIIKDITFIIVDTSEFTAEMTDEYYKEVREDLLDIINSSGYNQYDYLIENV